MPIKTATISLAEAQQLLATATDHAEEIGVQVAAVVVDGAGRLVACARMDGATLMGMDIATGKAYTAAGLNQPTELWDDAVAASPGFSGAITSIPGFTPFGGGKPAESDGHLIGAIGVSGGTLEQDIEIARVAVDSL
jgi:glc operon protein GlcG